MIAGRRRIEGSLRNEGRAIFGELSLCHSDVIENDIAKIAIFLQALKRRRPQGKTGGGVATRQALAILALTALAASAISAATASGLET